MIARAGLTALAAAFLAMRFAHDGDAAFSAVAWVITGTNLCVLILLIADGRA